ncbi:MAG: LacI family transcriptional regulator [bacterium]|nr:LacI family transcriptional regulator [bacterium]
MVTQKEIAELLKVSKMTISLALRDSPKVKKETRERIKRVARELNYYPSEIGRSLVIGKSYTIGIILPPFPGSFHFELLNEMQNQLRENGYFGFPLNANPEMNIEDEEERIMETFIRRRVDGVISNYVVSYKARLLLKKKNIPYILQAKPVKTDFEEDCTEEFVTCNKYKGAVALMEHLLKLGYRKIAYLCHPKYTYDEERITAYKDVLLKNGLPFKEDWIIHGSGTYEDGYKGMKKLLSLDDKPEAVFAMNDMAAIGAIRAIKEKGLKIPLDIAVVGFDNIKEAQYFTPSLTTIDQNKQAIAGKTVEILLNKIEKKEAKKEIFQITIEPKLIIRESCGYGYIKNTKKEVKQR